MKSFKDYRKSYNNHMNSKYDPEFYSTKPDVLRSETGKAVGWKSQLVPKREIADSDIIHHHPDLIHRGMSHEEYHSILKTGRIESKGRYNIGDVQKGLTYFTTQPASAVNYASSFAPSKHKPSPERHAYVVSVKKPSQDRIQHVEGTAKHEVGVKGHIPASDIVAVYRGRVIAHTTKDKYSSASSHLHWEKIEH